MGMPLVVGREFTDRDVAGAPLVAIVNESFASYFFGRDNPIGRRFGFRPNSDPLEVEIVGVVKDALYAEHAPGHDERERDAALRLHVLSAERSS